MTLELEEDRLEADAVEGGGAAGAEAREVLRGREGGPVPIGDGLDRWLAGKSCRGNELGSYILKKLVSEERKRGKRLGGAQTSLHLISVQTSIIPTRPVEHRIRLEKLRSLLVSRRRKRVWDGLLKEIR